MGTSMKILLVNLDGRGGAYTLINQIQKIIYPQCIFDYYWMGRDFSEKSKHEVTDLDGHIIEGNLRKNRLLGHLLLPSSFYHFLKKNPYKIIHINGDTAFKLLIYALPAKLAKCPCVIIHSHSSGINGDHKHLKLFMHRLCKPFLMRNADIYLTCSKKASEWMFTSFQNQAVMINNGVDLDKYKYSSELRQLYREKLGLKDEIIIGMVGNLSYQKYPEYMVNIMEYLPLSYKLVFIGDGPNKVNIENYVNDKGSLDRIIFYGQTKKVNELLNAIDIFCMTSRFEGLPVSAVEAQANGLPCILSDKMTVETRILSNCQFLSIEDSPKVWSDEIQKIELQTNKRDCATALLKKAGFDINDSANKILNIYRQGYRGR